MFVERGRDSVAIPFSTLVRRRVVRVTVGGHTLVVRRRSSIEVTENGRPVVFDQPFWFAVAAFRPDVRIVYAASDG